MNPTGLCRCGCGGRTRTVPRTNPQQGWVRGEPLSFIHGHNARREHSGHWKGGRYVVNHGYVRVTTNSRTYRYEHRLIAERVLGRPLPAGAVVHHVDDIGTNNANSNLVVLQSAAEHRQLHRRLRVLRAGGDPWTDRLCSDCERVKPATEFGSRNTKWGVQYRAECHDCRGRAGGL